MKTIAAILVISLALLGLSACTSGANPPEPSPSPQVSSEPPPSSASPTDETAPGAAPVRATYSGVVDSVEQSKVSIKETGSDAVTIVVTVSDNTYIIDGQTGDAKAIDALKTGEAIVAVTRPIQAQSMPPQSPGIAIFVNLPEEGLPPTFAVIKEVTTDAEGAAWLVTDESVNWRVSAETPLIPYKAGAPITFDQLKAGMSVVGWYSVTTRSMPAQATPDKILVIPGAGE